MIVEAILIGALAGVLSGLLGVGGGALFVPGLVLLLGLSQVEAEATSLLAIVPVALLGTWRQRSYGNLRMRQGIIIGIASIPAALLGVVLVNVLPERIIEYAFAALLLFLAWRMLRGAVAELRGG